MDEDLELLFVTTEDLLDATKHNMRLESWPETDRIMASGYTPGNRS